MLDAESLNKKGVDAGNKGDTKSAIRYFTKAVEKDPTHTLAIANLGLAYKNIGNFKLAIKYYEHALDLDPVRPKTLADLGSLYFEIGKIERAIEFYKKSVKIDPENAVTRTNLGTILADSGKHEAAVIQLKKAITLDPTMAEAYYNLGYIFQNSGSIKEAIFFFGETLKNNPEINMVYPHLYFMFRHACDWTFDKEFNLKLNSLLPESTKINNSYLETPFISFTRSENPKINYKIAIKWANKYAVASQLRIRNQESRIREKLKIKNLDLKIKRIRIGYVSDAFYDFPTAHNITDVILHHNTKRFQIYIYHHGPNDKSIYRRKIENAVYQFRKVKKLSDSQIAEIITIDKIDILVDLKGHMKGTRLGIFARRPCPISAAWMGFPATTGADYIDYIIADKVVIPQSHKKFYSEKVIYLPHCYRTPDTITPISKKSIKELAPELVRNRNNSKKTKQFVFASFNSSYKITPEMWNTWMNILKRVPRSILWIMVKSDLARKNLLAEAKARNVNIKRIIFADKLSKGDHLARLKLADLVLDTHPVNGHTTTTDCLRMSTPVLTMLGKHFASRVSASCLQAINLTELVTNNFHEYENLAVDLATNPRRLKELVTKLENNKTGSPLFDTQGFTKDLESIYINIIK